jgi:hypothetical protein
MKINWWYDSWIKRSTRCSAINTNSNFVYGTTTLVYDCGQDSRYLSATPHTRLKACDHCILRSPIGWEGQECPSSLHTRWWRPMNPKKLSWMKNLHEFPQTNYKQRICFSILCVRPTSKRYAWRKFWHTMLVKHFIRPWDESWSPSQLLVHNPWLVFEVVLSNQRHTVSKW